MNDAQVLPTNPVTDDMPLDPETIKTGKDFRPELLGLLIIAFVLFFSFIGKLQAPMHTWTLWQQYVLIAFWIATILYYVVFAVFTHRLHNFNAQFKEAEGDAMRARLRGHMYRTLVMTAITIGIGVRLHTIPNLSWPAILTILAEILNGTWILLFILARIVVLKVRKREQNI